MFKLWRKEKPAELTETSYRMAVLEYMETVGAHLDATTPADKTATLGALISTHEWITSHIKEAPNDALPTLPQR